MPNDPNAERLLDHSYDGIQEYDNPLPRWWVWIFYATVIFSVAYVVDPSARIRGPGRVKEYDKQLADAATRWPKPTGVVSDAALLALASDRTTIDAGKAVFGPTCSSCHRGDGGGGIGPNLTDEFWLHGSTLPEIRRTISEGVVEKGMPNWGKMLKPEQVTAVAVYVASIVGTNPPNPKPPQGDKAATSGANKE